MYVNAAKRATVSNPVRPGTQRRTSGRRWPAGPRLTDRDREILRWITRHGVVTPELVGQRFFWRTAEKKAGQWACYRRLAAMERLGLILRNKPFAHHPAILRVTREGARIADVGLRPAPLVLSQLNHTLAVVLLIEGLAYQTGGEFLTERELRAQRYRQRREGIDTSRGRCPDALLNVPAKAAGAQGITRVAIELDLTRKDRRAMERVVHQYDQETGIDRVWWYVPPTRVTPARDVIRDLAATNRFEIREWRART